MLLPTAVSLENDWIDLFDSSFKHISSYLKQKKKQSIDIEPDVTPKAAFDPMDFSMQIRFDGSETNIRKVLIAFENSFGANFKVFSFYCDREERNMPQ